MKRKTLLTMIVCAIAIAVLAAGILLYLMPQSSPIEIILHGAKMTAEGEILSEGEIIIRGTRIRSRISSDRIAVSEMMLVDTEVFSTDEDLHCVLIPHLENLPSEWIKGYIHTADTGPVLLDMMLGQRETLPHNPITWCVAALDGKYKGVYYVGSEIANDDWKKILNTYLGERVTNDP